MIRVGVSGWSYPEWRRLFYPGSLPSTKWLGYMSRRFASIEINATFYGPQPAARFDRWYDETPPGFIFAVKAPRQATHLDRLEAAEPIVARFFGAGLLRLAEKLGPILWQVPAGLAFDERRLDRFLSLLPPDTDAAARLGGTAAGTSRPLRHALEVRHESYRSPDFLALLRERGVALVVSDAPRWPLFAEMTADFAYVRLHGAPRLYMSGYAASELDVWAERILGWAADGRDAFVYLNNTMKGCAPFDALALADRLSP
jgi:uncharacterized protein YecE (DUF72 family)